MTGRRPTSRSASAATVRGIILADALVALAVTVTVAAAAFTLLTSASDIVQAQSSASGMQQDVRAAVDLLTREIRMAGAGFVTGRHAGALSRVMPGVLPLRTGLWRADPPGTFATDRVTLRYLDPTSAQTKIPAEMGSPSDPIPLPPTAGEDRPFHGFEPGMMAVLMDDGGRFDVFRIRDLVGPPSALSQAVPPLARRYQAGAAVAQIHSTTYWFDAARRQLRRYDGYRSDLPLMDEVVAFGVDYFGDPGRPAAVERLGPDGDMRWTTWGPVPPPGDQAFGTWPAGENCVFRRTADGRRLVARDEVRALPPSDGGLARLGPDSLSDGPWCPSAAAPGRVDADLYRVRRVRITLRVQAPSARLRGRGERFRVAGTSRGGHAYVPDLEVSVDVSPRNLEGP